VLILTTYDEDPYVFALLRAGADGYILKNADPDDLVRAVKTVATGGKVPAPDIAAKVIARATSGEPVAAAGQAERELEVLHLAAQGLTNKAIAAELGLSDRTVQGQSRQYLRQAVCRQPHRGGDQGIEIGLADVG
jgi:DNA-binding NarL/FixJ family response regulator